MRRTIFPTCPPASMRALASFSRAKSIDLVDLRLDAPAREMRHHFRDEAGHGSRTLRLAAQPVGYTEQGESPGVQGLEVEVGVQHAVDQAHGGKPAFEGERADILREDGAAHRR